MCVRLAKRISTFAASAQVSGQALASSSYSPDQAGRCATARSMTFTGRSRPISPQHPLSVTQTAVTFRP